MLFRSNGVDAATVQGGAAKANLGLDAEGYVALDIKGRQIQDDAGNVYLDPGAATEAMKLYGKKVMFCGGIYFGTEVGSMGNIHQYNNDLCLEAWDPVYSIKIDTKLNINGQRVYDLPAPSAVNDAVRCDDSLRAPDATALQGKTPGTAAGNVAFYDTNIRVVDSVKVGGYTPQGIRDLLTQLRANDFSYGGDFVAGTPTPDYYITIRKEGDTAYEYQIPCRQTIIK